MTIIKTPEEDDDGEWTEAHDANIPRVDLVGHAANGTSGFLMMKSDQHQRGLMDPADIRDLIAKATPTLTARDDVTFTGSPAAIAALIHGATLRKADESTQNIDDLPDSDFAYIESGGTKDDQGRTVPRSLRHFPIMDAAHTRNAMSRAPQSPFGDKAMPKIHAAAKRFGIDVAKETNMTADPITKASAAELAAAVVANPDTPLPDADEVAAVTPDTAPGDPDDPSSPAWEAVDAARARQALELTIALKRLVQTAANRETQEAVLTGDEGDADNVWSLEDVMCAIDSIVENLAPFAVTEQAEADQASADLTKSGRVLSTANEAKIRGAADALNQVLGALPAATDDAAPVAKGEPPMTDPVTKAKGDPQVAVYTADGKLVGTVDQLDISPITDAVSPASADDAPVEDAAAAPMADEAPAPEAPAPGVQPDANDGPATPQTPPPVPGEDPTITKDTDEITLTKSTLADLLKEALAPLQERLARVESQPMPGGPMLHGVTPGADPIALRGQADGDALKKAMDAETNPTRRAELQMEYAIDRVRNAPRTL